MMVNMRTSDFAGTLYIHVGPHKTGSTTIQHAIDGHRGALREQGLLYPKCGRGTVAPEQHWEFGEAVLHADTAALDQFITDIDAEIEAAQAERILISTEVLSRKYVTAQDLARIPQMFPKANRVWVALLRRQDTLASSLYAEQLKKGLIAYPDNEARIYGPEFLDHWQRLCLIAQASEADRIILGSFEVMKADLVANFLAMIECRVELETAVQRSGRQNVALPGNALSLLRMINALPNRVSWRIRQGVIAFAQSQPGAFGASRLEAKVPENLMERYRQGNRAIEDSFFAGRDMGLTLKSSESGPRARSDDPPKADGTLKARVTGWMPPEK